MITKLKLSPEELNTISQRCRERKFNIDKNILFYPKTYIEKLYSFLYSYRFLLSLYNSLDDEDVIKVDDEVKNISEKEIKGKIKNYSSQFEILYLNLLKLSISLELPIEYGKSSTKEKIYNIILLNELDINNIIDDVYPLGKIISMYDPDSAAGYS